MKFFALAAAVIALMSAPALAASHGNGNGNTNGQGAENRSPVATATLDALNSGVNVGQTISDRNTNPDNTYYQDNGYTGRGDEVSTLAHTKAKACHTAVSVTGDAVTTCTTAATGSLR
ncbi:MAG TPA: hypothetical protein VHB74_01670 [Devosia sp.]|nr:hypothetical protein [Devosia sp.]